MLASMEDGFSSGSKTITRDNQTQSTGISGKGNFGINVYSLFKLGIEGSKNKIESDESNREVEEGRVHTYGSLMNRLIKNLDEIGVIKRVEDQESWKNIVESDFVELQGTFIPNPIVNSLTRLNNLMNLFIKFSEKKLIPPYNNLNNPPIPKGIPKQKIKDYKKELKRKADGDLKNMQSLVTMLKDISIDLENQDYQKYIIELKSLPDHKIVTYLFSEFIRDRSGVELPNGEFKILGKVVRKVEGDNSIDLLEGTAVGLSDEIVDGFTGALGDMSTNFNIQEIYFKVQAPAIQIIPIAVFV
ncbi:hypothetical protein HYG87_02010 [Methanobacterium alkalithermotolerans]|uniref:Uncharacterized protein n=1 Tax=Methanobacterium alkalithermotolerans TaxID=2731220 RepID=A0A8T8K2G0_9EURY|nr:hypothetical protein [Methanobacterium alkalithermotolerans]QUH22628.1 hypothetical protein HYG87_02010 [Methanobacterium alkalithermotolerans]